MNSVDPYQLAPKMVWIYTRVRENQEITSLIYFVIELQISLKNVVVLIVSTLL